MNIDDKILETTMPPVKAPCAPYMSNKTLPAAALLGWLTEWMQQVTQL